MCGIAGFLLDRAERAADELDAVATGMADSLAHRGPDDRGVWSDAACGIALGHRRLSILDLSPSGHQPMVSADGRFAIVFNGEVYNHRELRRELAASGVPFRGHSDTEVLVEAIARWGLEAAISRSIGMFAYAVWDRRERQLFLVRDRLGIKPLYYGRTTDALLFGSELRALRAYPGFAGEIDRDAVALFLQHSYIPAPYTIYRGVYKLPPGTALVCAPGADSGTLRPRAYWNLQQVAAEGLRHPFTGTAREAVDELESLLRRAVELRMEADVPVGAFLSGGVDSTTVVALMQSLSRRPARTFTIGFTEAEYNEAHYAKAVAQHLGTEHVECYVRPDDALEVIPRLPRLFDEPFADSSQLPTYLVSTITRQHVTVSLSGDGGDELFCGYPRYAFNRTFWRRFGWLPWPLRRALAGALKVAAARRGPPLLRRKAGTLGTLLSHRTPREMYTFLNTHWKQPTDLVIGSQLPRTVFYRPEEWPAEANPTEALMYVDTLTYLPDDILTKVDRASMAVGLEARVPLLDHRVVEFAWKLPLAFKVRDGQTKWVLRQVTDRYVPRELLDRPKVGFGVPIVSWLRGPLRPWAEELLSENRLRHDGLFDPAPIRQKWSEHLSGRIDWHYYLWDVLMLQAWLSEHS